MLQHNSRKFSGGAYTGPYAQCYEWSQLLHHYLQNIEGEWEDAGRESLTTTILPTCSFPKPQLKMPRAATKTQHSQKQTKHFKKKKKADLLLPGESRGRRRLEGCRPWGRWGSDTTERLHFDFPLECIGEGKTTPVILPGESQGRGEPGGLPSMGSHRVGHDWSDLAVKHL